MQYFIGKSGQQSGPFSANAVKEMVRNGDVARTDLAWCEGMAQWRPVHEVLDIPDAETDADSEGEDTSNAEQLLEAAAAAEPVELAPRTARLGAWMVDRIAMLLTMAPLFPTLTRLHEEGRLEAILVPGMNPEDLLREFPQAAVTTASIAFVCLTLVQFFLLARQGQSIGKLLTGVRIVLFGTNGRAGFLRAVAIRLILPDLIGLLPVIGFAFPVVDTLCIFREDRRCLHDMMAGTHVIRA